jgi:hypothetical protein
MKIILIIWGIVILICILEAYFCTEWDPELEKEHWKEINEKRKKK